MKHPFLVALLLVTLRLSAQDASLPTWQAPPRLVVGIVVDQMRTDYIYRYWDNFGEDGFKRLIKQGSFQRDAHFTYMPTYTGPGHASIYTGTTPAHHGIVSNDRFDPRSRRTVYCVEDTLVKGVGSASPAAQRSPVQLLSTTIADELELRFDGKARTIGVALKDRSAVLPIGRMGDAAYWYIGGSEGKVVTSTWYRDELPAWVQQFNALALPEKYLKNTWSPLLPRERYHTPLPDDSPYEVPLARGLRPTLPVNLDSLRRAGSGLELLSYTPWGNTFTTDLALAAMDGEELGRDAITDLLALSYSAPDILGHRVGPRSIEEEDMYIRLDQEIARLLKALDERVGAGRYTVFLTADHGASDVPQYLKDQKASAGYVDMQALAQEIWKSMPAQVSGGQLGTLENVMDGQVHLSGSEAALEQFARRLMEHPAVAVAVTREQLQQGHPRNELHRMLANGFMSQRCGSIVYALRPGYIEAEGVPSGKGTTHGSGWNYDTHVPVIWYGQGVRSGEVLERTAIADIAPTVAAIVGMALPDASVGRVVEGSVKR